MKALFTLHTSPLRRATALALFLFAFALTMLAQTPIDVGPAYDTDSTTTLSRKQTAAVNAQASALGATTDPASSATGSSPASAIALLKEISALLQAPITPTHGIITKVTLNGVTTLLAPADAQRRTVRLWAATSECRYGYSDSLVSGENTMALPYGTALPLELHVAGPVYGLGGAEFTGKDVLVEVLRDGPTPTPSP